METGKKFYELTPVQHKMWVLDQMELSHEVYNLPCAYRVKGCLDINGLEIAIRTIIAQNDALRTVFVVQNDNPKQCVLDSMDFSVEILPSCQENEDVDELTARYIKENQFFHFDFSKGPLMRVAVLPYEDTKDKACENWLVLFNIHHIISDATSLSFLIAEIFNTYGKIDQVIEKTSDNSFGLFADNYAKWRESDEFIQELSWWKEYLKRPLVSLDLPTDYPRPITQTFKGNCIKKELDADTVDTLYEVADEHGVTPFSLLMALIKLILYKQTNNTDIIVGTPVQGRNITTKDSSFGNLSVQDNVIGCFINMLPIRDILKPKSTLSSYITSVGNSVKNALKHQSVPLESILKELDVERDMSRSPLFDCLFTYISHIEIEARMQGLDLEYIEDSNDLSVSRYDMVFQIIDTPEAFTIDFNYNTDLFSTTRMECIAEEFMKLCKSLAVSTHIPLEDLMLIGQQEKKILESFAHGGEVDHQGLLPLPLFVQKMAKEEPNAPTIVYPDSNDKVQNLNWREFAFITQHMALKIQEKNIQKSDIIAVIGSRTKESTLTLPAILSLNAIYAPIDKDLPHKRIISMLESVKPACVIIDYEENEEKIEGINFPCLEMKDIFPSDYVKQSLDFNLLDILPPESYDIDNNAYILFTSGSTGTPKASFTTQRAMLNTVVDYGKRFEIHKGKAYLQFAGFSFDAAVLNVLTPWYACAKSVLLSKDIINDVHRFAAWLQEADAKIAILPPAYLRLLGRENLIPSLYNLDYLVSAGEAASLEYLLPCIRNGVQVYNGYGPSETAVCATMYLMSEHENRNVPVGRPIHNVITALLGPKGQLLPFGTEGEIWIGGMGVSQGYLDAEQSAKAFIKHPVYGHCYKTGDKAKWNEDGKLIFLGRVDDQVKISGNRIEPSEVVHAIISYPNIKDAIVLPFEQENEDKCLAAWYILEEGTSISENDLRNYLLTLLPSYGIPRHFTPIDSIPITLNGKISVSALPKPRINQSKVAPSSEKEILLAEIWGQLLGKENISVNDNLFALGADSITAIRAISRLSQQGYKCTVKEIFKYATIATLALILEPIEKNLYAQALKDVPLSPIQKHFFHMSQFKNNALAINDSSSPLEKFAQIAIVTKENLSFEEAREKCYELWQKHDMLRVHFNCIENKGIPQQRVQDAEDNLFIFHTAEENESIMQMKARLIDEISLAENKLFIAGYHTNKDNSESYLLLAIHHLIVDGISWRILLDDLNTEEDLMPESQFGHYMQKLQESTNFDAEISYWQQATLPESELQGKFFSKKERVKKTYKAQSFKFSQKLTSSMLLEGINSYHANMEDFLLAALVHADICNLPSGHNKIQINLESHGRDEFFDIDLSRAVGWFTSLFPVVLEKQESIGQTLFAVKDKLRSVPNKGLGYGVLTDLKMQNIPLLSSHIEFNYLGQVNSASSENQYTFYDLDGYSDDNHPMATPLSVTCIIGEDNCLECAFNMDTDIFSDGEQQELLEKYKKSIEELLEHCLALEKPLKTGADYGDASISQKSLESALDFYGDIESIRPLNAIELRTYYDLVMNPHTAPTYIKQSHYRFKELDIDTFLARAKNVWQKHENLRMVCPIIDNVPRALILKDRKESIIVKDLRHLATVEQRQYIDNEKAMHKAKIVDISKDTLLHIGLYQISDTVVDMTITFTHIVFDRWGAEVFYDDLSKDDIGTNTFDMRDYSQWLKRQDIPLHHDWWKNELKNVYAPTHIYGVNRNFTYNQGDPYPEEVQNFNIDDVIVERCKKLSEDCHLTMSTIYQSALATILQVYTGNDDIFFHSIYSLRPAEVEGIETCVGFFTNLIPCRFPYTSELSFKERTKLFQEKNHEREEHIAIASSTIYEQTPYKNDLSDVLFIMENLPTFNEDSKDIENVYSVNMTGSPLTLTVEGLHDFNFNYNPEIIDRNTITAFATMFVKFLDIASTYPDKPLNAI